MEQLHLNLMNNKIIFTPEIQSFDIQNSKF